jgi:uracil-DNA glycosylase
MDEQPSLFSTEPELTATAAPPEGLPEDWARVLAAEFGQPYFRALQDYVAAERARGPVYPPDQDVYAALRHTPYERVKALLLGQDPYHGPGQAHGLCFSVLPGLPLPPTLANIFRELKEDLGIEAPRQGCLTRWADQGVLLLNAVLTVRAGEANSHKARGWERFTDAVIRAVNAKPTPVVFLLWGAYAQKKAALIDARRHRVIQSAHPSPLSAHAGFFGSKPFSAVNCALRETGQGEIDWRLI